MNIYIITKLIKFPPDGQGLAGGSPGHCEDETSFGALGGAAEEGGRRPDSCRKVLPSGSPVGASFWGGNMGIDGNDAAKTGGVTRGFLEAGGVDIGE